MLDKKFLKSSWRLLKCDSDKISSDASSPSLTCCIGITFIQNLKRSWEDLSLSQLINRKKNIYLSRSFDIWVLYVYVFYFLWMWSMNPKKEMYPIYPAFEFRKIIVFPFFFVSKKPDMKICGSTTSTYFHFRLLS